jgi:predicted SAM-dependent methyltransferase
MCAHTAERLSHLPNVETVPISGWDLSVIPSASVDVVYSTVVFMHIEEWERYSYVSEGLRVLRPGGRMFADALDLTSDAGWDLFCQVAQSSHPMDRQPQVSKSSTPEEMQVYFERAGFEDIKQLRVALWVMTWGNKPG